MKSLTANELGHRTEILVGSWFLAKGWKVYWPDKKSKGGTCDLIVELNSSIVRIEVKTLAVQKHSQCVEAQALAYSKGIQAIEDKWDWLAIVDRWSGEIFFFDRNAFPVSP